MKIIECLLKKRRGQLVNIYLILMECGHIAQNLYLISEAMRLKCCAIGGFVDEEFNKLLYIQGQSEKTMYLMAIGK